MYLVNGPFGGKWSNPLSGPPQNGFKGGGGAIVVLPDHPGPSDLGGTWGVFWGIFEVSE